MSGGAEKPIIENHRVTGHLLDSPYRVPRENGAPLVVFLMTEKHHELDKDTNQWVDVGETRYEVGITDEALGRNIMFSLRDGDRITVEGRYQAQQHAGEGTSASVTRHRIVADEVSASLNFSEVQIFHNDADIQKEGLSAVSKGDLENYFENDAVLASETDFNAII